MLDKGRNLGHVRQKVERVKASPGPSLAASVLARAAADCGRDDHWPGIEAFMESPLCEFWCDLSGLDPDEYRSRLRYLLEG